MSGESRLWEIDSARGVAILMMIVFHTVFDLSFFSIFPVDVATGFWRYFAYATATLFLLIVGISLVISHARAAARLSGIALAKKFVLRGAGIFALGLLVTLATWLYLPEGYVIFGILHVIGISVMLSPLFFRFRIFNVLWGLIFIAIGWFVISHISLPSPSALLLPLGIHGPAFWSVDYTPVFPWTGVVLIGMGLGAYLYAGGTRQFSLRPLPDLLEIPLSFLGRHSLVIYLVHQPLIILFLAAVTGVQIL
jgi:uncharacterized membrane protein